VLANRDEDELSVTIPDTLPILALRSVVLFPRTTIDIDVGRARSLRLIEDAIARDRNLVGILTQKDANTEDPRGDDLYAIGCVARILRVTKYAPNNFSVRLEGVSRFEVSMFNGPEAYLTARVRSVVVSTSSDVDGEAILNALRRAANRIPELPGLIKDVTDAGSLADFITARLELKTEEKQRVLEMFDVTSRARVVEQFVSMA